MKTPQNEDDVRPFSGVMVDLRVRIPREWQAELFKAAASQRISVADLVRIVLRGFLRERYDEEAQRRLGL